MQAEQKKQIHAKPQTKGHESPNLGSEKPTLKAVKEGHIKPSTTSRTLHIVASHHRTKSQ